LPQSRPNKAWHNIYGYEESGKGYVRKKDSHGSQQLAKCLAAHLGSSSPNKRIPSNSWASAWQNERGKWQGVQEKG